MNIKKWGRKKTGVEIERNTDTPLVLNQNRLETLLSSLFFLKKNSRGNFLGLPAEQMEENRDILNPNPSHLARLLDGCRQRDRASQSEVYRLFYRYALTIAQAYSGTMDEAREVVNDAFLRAFTKIEQYDPTLPFKPWFNRVVVHTAIDHYRRYQAKQPQTSTCGSIWLRRVRRYSSNVTAGSSRVSNHVAPRPLPPTSERG